MLQRFHRCGLLLLLTLSAATGRAQMHKVAPPEKVTRAIAVYEWTGDLAKPTAARIVPITIFINGHLEDAGVYLIHPMPFVLETGDVYSIEQAGKAQGTVDIDYARNILPPGSTADTAAVGAWYGYGKYAPLPPPSAAPPLKPSAHIAAIDGGSDSGDDRPHFVGKQPNESATDDTTPAKPTIASSSTTPADDPDRPHMNRRPGSSSDDSSTTTSTTASTDTGTVPDSDPDAPTLRHRDPTPQTKEKKQKNSDSAVIPMATSLNDDPNRPTMRRGKPAGSVTSPELTTTPPDLHQITAISDAVNRDPHIFAREWSTHTEHAETLTQIEALAQTRVAQYLTTYHLTPPALNANTAPTSGAPGPNSGTRASTASSPNTTHSQIRRNPQLQPAAPPQLLEEQLTPYTLTYGGLPTFVYTAQSPITTGGPVYITLVAQRLPSGELQVALASITDASHLDRTPWFRFIDAVDPDASHRASLLFELRAQTTRQFALYQLITAHAEQQFLTGTIQ